MPRAGKHQARQQGQRRDVEDEIDARVDEEPQHRQHHAPAGEGLAALIRGPGRSHATPQPAGEEQRREARKDEQRRQQGAALGQQLYVVVMGQIARGGDLLRAAIVQIVQLVAAEALAHPWSVGPHLIGRTPHGEPVLRRLVGAQAHQLARHRRLGGVAHDTVGQRAEHEQHRDRRAPGRARAAQTEHERQHHQPEDADRAARGGGEQRPQAQRQKAAEDQPGAARGRHGQRHHGGRDGEVEQRPEGIEVEKGAVAAVAGLQPFDDAPEGKRADEQPRRSHHAAGRGPPRQRGHAEQVTQRKQAQDPGEPQAGHRQGAEGHRGEQDEQRAGGEQGASRGRNEERDRRRVDARRPRMGDRAIASGDRGGISAIGWMVRLAASRRAAQIRTE